MLSVTKRPPPRTTKKTKQISAEDKIPKTRRGRHQPRPAPPRPATPRPTCELSMLPLGLPSRRSPRLDTRHETCECTRVPPDQDSRRMRRASSARSYTPSLRGACRERRVSPPCDECRERPLAPRDADAGTDLTGESSGLVVLSSVGRGHVVLFLSGCYAAGRVTMHDAHILAGERVRRLCRLPG